MAIIQQNIFRTIGHEFLSRQTATTVKVATFHLTTPTMAMWLLKHVQGSGITGCRHHAIGCQMLIMIKENILSTLPR